MRIVIGDCSWEPQLLTLGKALYNYMIELASQEKQE